MTKTAATAEGGYSEIVAEVRQLIASLPHKWNLAVMLVGWVALFSWLGNSTFGHIDSPSLFRWLLGNYNSPFHNDDHGLWMPFIVLGLMVWKRQTLTLIPKSAWWPAVPGVVLALVVHILGFLVQQQRLSAIGFFLGLYSLMGCCWGRAWMKATAFPFIFFAFCIPIGSLSEVVTLPLRIVATQLSVGFCQWFLGMDILREGTMIFSAHRTFQYDVAPACSGIRSIIALLALTMVYAFVFFRSFWRQGVLILSAIPLAVAGNVVRLICVIIVAELFGENAGKAIEQNLGVVTFIVALTGLVMIGRSLERLSNGDKLALENP